MRRVKLLLPKDVEATRLIDWLQKERHASGLGFRHQTFGGGIGLRNNVTFQDVMQRQQWGKNNVTALCKEGRFANTLKSLRLIDQQSIPVQFSIYASLLRECISLKDLTKGKQVHTHIMKSVLAGNIFLGNNLVTMYARCGSLMDARQVFEKMTERNVVSWTSMITGCAEHGYGEEALKLLWQMHEVGMKPNRASFLSALSACASLAALGQGKLIHATVVDSGLDTDVIVMTALVNMYSKCARIEDARRMFTKIPKRDVVSWTAMIGGCAQNGHCEEALQLFWKMQKEGLKPNKVTFICILNACASMSALKVGKQVHEQIIASQMESDVRIGIALVNMYGKCASMVDAWHVFEKVPKRDVVLWNAVIAGFAKHGQSEAALKVFWQLQKENIMPNEVTFISVVNACATLEFLAIGKLVHSHIINSGILSDNTLKNALVDMYAKCGCIEEARHIFDKMDVPDVISWTTLITGYAHCGHFEEAIGLLHQMQNEGVNPNQVTFISVLNACASYAALKEGKLIHSFVTDNGMESDGSVSNALVDMYAKCGSLEDAQHVFDRMQTGHTILWSTMIAGYAQHGHSNEAFKLLWHMQKAGMNPNELAFVTILNICTSLREGKLVHDYIVACGMELNMIVGTALIDMYSRCASIEDASEVFSKMPKRDIVLWNVMIAGFTQHEHFKEALDLFWQMQQEGMEPDQFTFTNILCACAHTAALLQGKQVHSCIIKSGFESDLFVRTALVDMYAKCGAIDDAHQVFGSIPERDLVLWNTMIIGCAKHGHAKEALKLFQQMQSEGIKPDQFTLSGILNACASLAALEQGKQVHSYIIEAGCVSDMLLGAALVDMYAKCGSVRDAFQVFETMTKRDVVSWNSIIAGCAQHGYCREALELFQRMQLEGQNPDKFTFSSILTACSHAGLIDEGCSYFDSMSRDHGITPTVEHYASMVDLLGRAGRLADAEKFINKMPLQPSVVVWMSLLGACRNHGNMELAEHAAKHILQLEPTNAAALVLLANIYGASGRRNDEENMRKVMKIRGMDKEPD